MNWSEIFRQAIRDSGKSLAHLARASEMQASQLSYFMRGERGLSIDTAERLANQLGLELVSKKDRAPVRKKQSKR